jgi:hypothetical protein
MAIKNGEWVKFEGTQEDAEKQLKAYAGKWVMLLILEDEQHKVEVGCVKPKGDSVVIYNDQPNAKQEDSHAIAICYSSTGVYPLPPKEFFVDETKESKKPEFYAEEENDPWRNRNPAEENF